MLEYERELCPIFSYSRFLKVKRGKMGQDHREKRKDGAGTREKRRKVDQDHREKKKNGEGPQRKEEK